MSQNIYEIIALAARYVFAGLMVLIVLRAGRLTLVDSRRAQTLRRLSPETGLSGELIVLDGDGQARRGMRYPVIREGLIGSSRKCDIRIRNGSVRRRHARFLLTEEGLSIAADDGAPMRDRRGRAVKELTLKDGGVVSLGRVKLMLVLAESTGVEGEEAYDEFDPDRLFATQPVLRRQGYDLFDEWDEE